MARRKLGKKKPNVSLHFCVTKWECPHDMRNRLRTLLVFLLLTPGFLVLYGQDARCLFDMEQHQDPGRMEREHRIQDRIRDGRVGLRNTLTIPIVFHVVYFNASQNLPDEVLYSQVDALNRDFAHASDNLGNYPQAIRALGVDTDIRFCIAAVNPQGEAQVGILRVNTLDPWIANTFFANGRRSLHYDAEGGSSAWDPARYLNIWVTNYGDLLGRAYFPGEAPYPEEDGIILNYRYTGTLKLEADAAPYDRGHSLTHEIGHYFSLLHIWGPGTGSCATDDLVEDTPLQALPYFDCPSIPQESCGSEDLFMNFMDFTDDRCLAFFTPGQRDRMHAALIEFRSGLLDGNTRCPAITGNPASDLDNNLLVYFDRTDGKIIAEFDQNTGEEIEVMVFAMDGRLIRSDQFQNQFIYWVGTDRFPPGVFIMYFKNDYDSYVVRIPVY